MTTVFGKELLEGYDKGHVSTVAINELFRKMASIQFRLGLFDSKEKAKNIPQNDIILIGSPQHCQLALETALQSVVLLQNNSKLLPLSLGTINSIALIGPHYNATGAFFGNYHGSNTTYGYEFNDATGKGKTAMLFRT